MREERPRESDGDQGGMSGGGGGCWGGVCGIQSMFGLEGKAQSWALRRIMEERGRRKGGLWMCAHPHRWSARWREAVCARVFVQCTEHAWTFLCLFADVGTDARALSAC